MKILLTGCAGFIGGSLLERLVADGHKVLGLDDLSIHNGEIPDWIGEKQLHKRANLILGMYGDCTKMLLNAAPMLMDFKPDVIFNLAVLPLPQSLEAPIYNFDTNTQITEQCLELVRILNDMGKNTRLVQFSSSEVYGTKGTEDMDEHHRLQPNTPYAAAKAACDHLVLSFVETFGIDAVIARPFNTIGERQNDKSYAAIIPLTARRMREGIPPVIYGDGSATRDYTYVGDIVDGAVKVMTNGRTGEVYNLCSGKETSVKEVMNIISELVGYEGGYQYSDERRGDVKRHRGDNTKASVRLGWNPKVELREAIRRAINAE